MCHFRCLWNDMFGRVEGQYATQICWVIHRTNVVPLIRIREITDLLNSVCYKYVKATSLISDVAENNTAICPKPLYNV